MASKEARQAEIKRAAAIVRNGNLRADKYSLVVPRRGERLKRPDVVAPVIDLSEGRWTIWVCSRCGRQEHELPSHTRCQIAGLRAGTWPTPGMYEAWPANCYCGGIVREVEVMVKPPRWECPGCRVDLGAPECEECGA